MGEPSPNVVGIAEREAARLGEQLRVLRARKRLSQPQVAGEAGVAQHNIARVEGGHVPSLRVYLCLRDWVRRHQG